MLSHDFFVNSGRRDGFQEGFRYRNKKKKWAAIVNLTSQVKSLYDAYVLNGDGEIGEPREVFEDKDL